MKVSKFGRLKQLYTPQSLNGTPLVPIEIAGERHNLRFSMSAVGQVEAALQQDVLAILGFLAGAAAGGRFSVRTLLAVIAAGIEHEYQHGYVPDWQAIGDHIGNLADLAPLIKPAMEALTTALTKADQQQAETEDPNGAEPAEESTGLDSTDSPVM